MKSPDICGARGCSSCHAVVDGSVKTPYSKDEIKAFFYEGVLRTLAEVDREVDFVKR